MFPLGDDHKVEKRPIVTVLLMVVCAYVFLHDQFPGRLPPHGAFFPRYALVPSQLSPISLLTSMFMHGGWFHIVSNMVFLWAFGKSMEDAMGHARFLTLYLLCGILAGLVHVAFNFYSNLPTVGASGAIAGVMGAYLLRFPRAWIHTLVVVVVFFFTVEIPAWFFVIYWFAMQVFSGWGSLKQIQISGSATAWFAHIGGFLAGMLLVSIMGTRRGYVRLPDRRR